MKIRISPSILNCDIGRLADELAVVAGADRIHIDVMDNHFVPNLTWGLPIVQAAKKYTEVPLEAHLMIEDPDRWALGYAEEGCQMVTFHLEAATAPITLARELRSGGAKVGIAVRPATPVESLLDFLDEFDMVLVMTVEPGFGGQKFLPQVLSKTRTLRRAVAEAGLPTEIQVDGGINRQTIIRAAQAGVDNFVVGSALYGSRDPAAEVHILRELAAEHCSVA